ncbi:MAG: bifunctional (p)ppGpp synthetase/guanosine-3',5'-bis(diphosphate) 3'-pyrophosphohydrolase [Bacteroidetes bacterium]|nr:bifunctional (p)ppGpp synthetase/guanosine-3',5'-bis(diphosphate) 3'-pyrophosphohydrolase [Bacteroidota bacterium]
MPDAYTEDEKHDILNRYRQLMRAARPRIKKQDVKKIRKAFDMALEQHQHMKRKSGEPYIHHPIEVAKIVAGEVNLGATSIICALLHDTVEDTDLTLEDVTEECGEQIAHMIDGLTKISHLTETSQSVQAENFRKIIFTLGDDIRVIIIKLADRLHNMRTLGSMPARKQQKIASETIYLYAPLAHRLGLYAIKSEMEDLSMKYLERDKYSMIAKKLNEKKKKRTKFISEFCKPLRQDLEVAGLKAKVFGRPKSIASIAHKMKKKDVEFDEVYDKFAIRVILDSPLEAEKEDIWRAYSIVAGEYKPNPNRLRDWISNPKSNGYESLHTTVMGPKGQWVEVQIRSKRMDEVAEKGLAAHWKYKQGKIVNENIDRAFENWLVQVRDLLKNPDMNPLEFMNEFKLQLYTQEIYVFTPKGDIKNLPKGCTALDFAFSIHTAVGSKCIGAKINGKLEPISHVLKNGDQVEILTSNKQKPNEGWSKFVVTSRAKSKIKQALKEERKRTADDGKELLMRKMKKIKANFNGENVQFLTSYFEMPSTLEFYYQIAMEKIDLLKIRGLAVEAGKFIPPKPKLPSFTETIAKVLKRPRKAKPKSNQVILFGENTDGFAYEFAKCCEPIPGDDVLGFISVSGGVKIHRTNCPNAINLASKYGYRIIKTTWASEADTSFLAGLKLTGTDDMGLINKLTSVISNDYQVNMKSLSLESKDNVFTGDVRLYVKDNDQLNSIIKKLKSLNGIIGVQRIEIPSKDDKQIGG